MMTLLQRSLNKQKFHCERGQAGKWVIDFRCMIGYLQHNPEKTVFASNVGIQNKNNQSPFTADHLSDLMMGLCFAI